MTKITTLNGAAMSSLCFGTMQFGGTADEAASCEMYDACRARGVNFFDTAHVYTDGRSEELLGKLANAERENLIIATKAAYLGGAGSTNIRTQLDESPFETLATLQSDGLIRYIGVSNYAAWQVMKAQAVAQRFGTRIDILQPMYSLVKRQAEVELLPMAMDQGIAVAPYSPLGGGLLTGKYGQGGGGGRLKDDARYAARYGQDWMHNSAAALSAWARERGIDPATLAVAWAARHPGVTAPIISARNAGQLAPSLAAIDLSLGDKDYAALSALSPKPAPATDRLEEG